MISSELPEVLGVSDRVLVMREGRLVAEFSHERAPRGGGHVGGHGPARGGGVMRAVLIPSRQQRPDGRRRPAAGSGRASPSGSSGARIRHPRRPRGVRRGHHGGPAPVPRRDEHPVRAGRHDRLRAAGARRDDGGDQPERRPVGRVGPRAVGVPVLEPVRPAPGHPHPGRVPGRPAASALACGAGQRHHGGRRPGPEPGGHAGHAVHHPRHRHLDRRRQARSSRRRCPARSCRSPSRRCSASPTWRSWSRS